MEMKNVKIETSKTGDTSTMSIELRLSRNTKTIPAEQQAQIREGIGVTLAAAMTPAERAGFVQKLQAETARSQQREEARKTRKDKP